MFLKCVIFFLMLYCSYDFKISKHDHSAEDISKAIDKFYDKSTKDSTVCSSDLESLEKQILKSQQELNDLKLYEELYKYVNYTLFSRYL